MGLALGAASALGGSTGLSASFAASTLGVSFAGSDFGTSFVASAFGTSVCTGAALAGSALADSGLLPGAMPFSSIKRCISLILFSSCAIRVLASTKAFSRTTASSSSARNFSFVAASPLPDFLLLTSASPLASLTTSFGASLAADLSSTGAILPRAIPLDSVAGESPAASATFCR